jgi:hypothetical protein
MTGDDGRQTGCFGPRMSLSGYSKTVRQASRRGSEDRSPTARSTLSLRPAAHQTSVRNHLESLALSSVDPDDRAIRFRTAEVDHNPRSVPLDVLNGET